MSNAMKFYNSFELESILKNENTNFDNFYKSELVKMLNIARRLINNNEHKMSDLSSLIGKYLNGYKIVKIETDPFIKGQINLFTDEWKYEAFNDRSLVIFRVREEPNTAKIYQELVDKENHNLKQTINEIREYVCGESLIKILVSSKINERGETHYDLIRNDILKIMEKLN